MLVQRNIVPNSAGATRRIAVLPELNGKLIGCCSARSTWLGSLTNLYAVVDKKVTVDRKVNAAMKAFRDHPRRPLVTAGMTLFLATSARPHGFIFDATQTHALTAITSCSRSPLGMTTRTPTLLEWSTIKYFEVRCKF